MRVYEILDANGSVVGRQEMETSMAPVLGAGQHARLVEVGGHKITTADKHMIGPDAEPMPEKLTTVEGAAELAKQTDLDAE